MRNQSKNPEHARDDRGPARSRPIGIDRRGAVTSAGILLASEPGAFDRFLKEDLRRSGHVVREAFSPFEMVNSLRAGRIDLVITDLYLNFHSGRSIVELCRLICPACRIVVAASWARELVERTIPASDVDMIVSSACRYEEVRRLLDRMPTAIERDHYDQ